MEDFTYLASALSMEVCNDDTVVVVCVLP